MYGEAELLGLLLDYADGLSGKLVRRISENFTSLGELLNRISDPDFSVLAGEETELAKLMLTEQRLEWALRGLEERKISFLTRESGDYPRQLGMTDDAPRILYCRGDLSLLKKQMIAVVGTRNCTSYGRDVARCFAAEFARAGLAVVSGMAAGIDAAAHEAALEQGVTVGVLGTGLDYEYPAENAGLYRKVMEKNGLLVTEYRPDRKGAKHTYPMRNRIMAGLCLAVVVAEAPFSSGAMITAERARDYDRRVFCVPGSIFSKASSACNRYLKCHPESIALGPEDVLELLGIAVPQDTGPAQESGEELFREEGDGRIIGCIRSGATVFDDILEQSGLTSSELNSRLVLLEMQGLVKKEPGNRYIILGERNRK